MFINNINRELPSSGYIWFLGVLQCRDLSEVQNTWQHLKIVLNSF